MTANKRTVHARAQVKAGVKADARCLLASAIKTTVIKSRGKKSVATSSPKSAFAEDLIPTFGSCYEELIKQYCRECQVDASAEQKMLTTARDVFAPLHDEQLHEIMSCNVDECIEQRLSINTIPPVTVEMAVEIFNAVILTAFFRGIIKKVHYVNYHDLNLVVADHYRVSVGENLECSGFKKEATKYEHLMNFQAEECLKMIYANLKFIKTENHYDATKFMLNTIGTSLVNFMQQCGLYREPFSHKERKALVGTLVVDTLMMARPKLDVFYIGNIIAGLNLLEEQHLNGEEAHG